MPRIRRAQKKAIRNQRKFKRDQAIVNGIFADASAKDRAAKEAARSFEREKLGQLAMERAHGQIGGQNILRKNLFYEVVDRRMSAEGESADEFYRRKKKPMPISATKTKK